MSLIPQRRYLPIAWGPCAASLLLWGGISRGDADEVDIRFDRDIRPILAEHCIGCHGGDEPEANFRLTGRDAAIAGGDSGPAIVPGNPDASELFRRITVADRAERMPPEEKKPLRPEEIERLREWIQVGVPWSAHWAFEPLRRPSLPPVVDLDWTRNPIDRFVLSLLESRGVRPSPSADRYTLIKRLYLDLLGLPPEVEEVDRFVQSRSPWAYEELVDRLLQSPFFGERWGRHWLDLAHYADSDGYEKDRARPDAYVYRDWVIDAINRDLCFDQFTVEQLAGDLLPQATARQKIAAAFYRQTLTNEEGGVDQEEYRINAVFDRTETVGTVWLGLTIGCARCHNHKYDPLPQDDYYRLFSFFNNADEVAPRLPVSAVKLDELEQRLAPLEEALAARYRELSSSAAAWEAEQYQLLRSQANDEYREHPLEVAQVESKLPLSASFEVQADTIRAPRTERVTTVVAAKPATQPITGFMLFSLPDDSLPHKGAGHAADGNFVVTGFRAFLVPASGPVEPIPLHRVKADYVQTGYAAESVLADKGMPGWGVGGKTTEGHWIQFRTKAPLSVPANTQLRFEIAQEYGEFHTLGKYRIASTSGLQRGLHFARQDIADGLALYPEKRVGSLRQKLFDYYVEEIVGDERVRNLRQEIDQLFGEYPAQLINIRTVSATRLPRKTHLFDRGDFLAPRHEVEPGTPEVLANFRPRSAQADRLDLAHWLVSPENGLASRVAVNHVWRSLFGEGIVRTMNDFGVRGEPPTYPELLDWLAASFSQEMGWSRKELIRCIVLSSTYRQASQHRPELAEIDPHNHWLARQNRFRVEGEIVRDLHLAASRLLSMRVGGPSVYPPMPADLASLSYAGTFQWTGSVGEDRFRRGMYTFFKRTMPHPNLTTFDCPDANVACVQRNVSNTPLQALTLLNNEVHVEAAQAMAKHLWQDFGGDQVAKLQYAMRSCVARHPTSEELQALQTLLSTARQYYADHHDDARQFVGAYAPAGASLPEAAAWVACTRVVLNLDEFYTRE